MRDDGVREHVDAQRGGGDDDDAGGDGDPAAAAGGGGGGAVGSGVEVLQGGGAGGDIRGGGGRDEHADGDRCQPDIGGDVEELLPRSRPHQLQHLVLLRLPSRLVHLRGAVGHTLLALLQKGDRWGPLRLFG